MGELIPIENGCKEWAVNDVRCLTCGTEWVAVYPASCNPHKLQCPTCLEQNSEVIPDHDLNTVLPIP